MFIGDDYLPTMNKPTMTNNRTCFIIRGAPGTGKSVKALEIAASIPNTIIVSADDYWMVDGKYVFDASRLGDAHAQCFRQFSEAVAAGRNVIVDNTNLNYKDICKYIDYLLKNNNLNHYIYNVELVQVQYNSIEKAIELRSNRDDGKNIPENHMRQMFKKFKEDIRGHLLTDYKGKIGLGELDLLQNTLPWTKPVEGLPEAITCDLDGTLAIFEYTNGLKIRSPYAAELAESDFICRPVAMALGAFFNAGIEVIFVSGRADNHRAPTEAFLERASDQYGFTYNDLHMRKVGDSRSDVIVKKEIYDEFIKDQYNIVAVFDDRRGVISLWRSEGLYVFDCNYRNEDF